MKKERILIPPLISSSLPIEFITFPSIGSNGRMTHSLLISPGFRHTLSPLVFYSLESHPPDSSSSSQGNDDDHQEADGGTSKEGVVL